MNKTLFEMLVSTLIGTTITIGGLSIKSEDAVHSAQSAVNSANVHQLATVLELYYDDHQSYPDAKNGQELVDELVKDDYLKTRPTDATIFDYASKDNGQDYSLALKD